jgi:putative Mg2+ transporter-C (MgtC) family protein
MSVQEVVQRLLVIAVLSGIVGLDRERRGHAAGLRTHILVGVGACLVMLTGLYLVAVETAPGIDPSRMAAQVVSGIGFLGAGTIIQQRASVRGLTTAASLWAVGGIGLAVGSGFYSAGLIATAVVLFALFGLSRLEHVLKREWTGLLVVDMAGTDHALVAVRRVLHDASVEIADFKVAQEGPVERLELTVRMPSKNMQEHILRQLQSISGCRGAHWGG